MTVQDFIVNYSATFEYLHKRYGKAAVVALWDYLGETNTELYNMVADGGLEGYLRYFYADTGTCSRENVEGGAWIDENGLYTEHLTGCPSVGELEERGKRPYRYYCEHCYWLYHKSLEDHGFTYDADFELQPRETGYSKQCTFWAKAREDAI